MKEEFARVALVLFGRSLSSYPFVFTSVGPTQRNGRGFDVGEARASDGNFVRLAIRHQVIART